ncbi:hypothetical protein D3C87_1372780 [compost metagenome]
MLESTTFRLEEDAPHRLLRDGDDFNSRAADWLAAAHNIIDSAVEAARDLDGYGEEDSITLTARRADFIVDGLALISQRLRGALTA